MEREKTHIDIALQYTILQLIFLVLGLLLVYILPVYFVVIPLVPLFLFSYLFGIISVRYQIKGRKEPLTISKFISLISTILVLSFLTFVAVYVMKNQSIF